MYYSLVSRASKPLSRCELQRRVKSRTCVSKEEEDKYLEKDLDRN